jgi:anti-sigma factor RsiW
MSTSTHPVAPEEVMAFLDGELSADRAQSVSAHIEQCAECRETAATLRNASHLLSTWAIAAAPTKLDERVRAASQGMVLHSTAVDWIGVIRTGSWVRKHWVVALGASAATLVVLFAIATPNLMRSRMAANEASAIGRARAEETARATAEYNARTAPRNSRGMDALQGKADAAKINTQLAQDGRAQVSAYIGALPAATQQARTRNYEPRLAEPMIARTVSLSIVVKDFDASRVALDAILVRHNGYAAELNVATPQGAARSLQGSLRIPAPQLIAAVAELKALGRVEVETQNGEEVTQQHADLVARLKNSRETEQRLQDVLRTRTGKVKDVLEVEEEIARVRGEIEQMEAEQQNLEHRVSFATIDLKLAEEYKAQLTSPAPSAGMQLRNATVNGFRNASESLLGIILFFAEAGPTLLLWLTILFIPARLLWRRYRRVYALEGSSLGA